MHIQELARRLGASVDPDADLEITGPATIEDAGPGEITFLANKKYAPRLHASRAGAVLVDPAYETEEGPLPIRVENPYLAFARAIGFFYEGPKVTPGIHPTAVVGENVRVGEDVAIGPYVVIGRDVRLGDGAVLHPHVVVYQGAEIGCGSILHSFSVVREHVRLGAGVILQNGVVVGADGFGFAPRADRSLHKIPQAGTAVVDDHVEIQANACVDRATVGTTRVGRGTKIDNLAQVGHGCTVGEDVLLCGQVGLAGSTHIGNRVILTGQVGVAGHCAVCDDVTVAAQSGVAYDILEPGAYGGSPVMDMATFRRWVLLQPKVPGMSKRLKALEKRVATLEEEARD
ncbi:MAG: UDP-3-O-(3-hydroxymyristoyl)glucosamine N-acyltransferase [Planctomycetota bacterium]